MTIGECFIFQNDSINDAAMVHFSVTEAYQRNVPSSFARGRKYLLASKSTNRIRNAVVIQSPIFTSIGTEIEVSELESVSVRRAYVLFKLDL